MANLIVPRKRVYFEPHEGRTIKLTNDFPAYLEQPLVRVYKGSVEGLESGYRSGIITIDGQMYRAKGCRPTEKIIYREPKGSQFFWMAQYEAERVQEMKDVFLREGYSYPIEPVGFWIYENIRVRDEPTAATLYKIKGDTRLDEFMCWLEKDLAFTSVPNERLGDVIRMFQIFGAMTGRILKIFHNHNYSWDWFSYGKPHLRISSHPGNVVVYENGSGAIDFGIVDLDNVVSYNPSEESDIMKDAQKFELESFKENMYNWTTLYHYKVDSGSRRKLPVPISRRMSNFVKKTFSDLDVYDLSERGIDISKIDFENNANVNTIRGEFIRGIIAGYEKPDMKIPELSLKNVKEFRKYVQTVGNLYKKKVKEEVSSVVSKIMMEREQKMAEEEQRKCRHWSRIDDGYGFSDGSHISVMFDDWIPRIRVYADHTEYCLEGVSPKLGIADPEKQGFIKSNIVLGKMTPMTTDEIGFHLREVSEAFKWWNSDMKVKDENKVYPTKEHMIGLYKEVFNYGIGRTEVPEEKKTELMNMLNALSCL